VKLRAIAPALLALAALIALYVYVTRDPEPAASAPAKPPVATAPTPAVAAPAPMPPPPSAPATAAPNITPHVLTSDEYAGHEPHAKKAKMTLDEKLAETRTHIEVMERRAKLLEAEIAELERSGQNDKAAEQRVVLSRLKAHADKLREDVAAGREPE
jgi:3-oxoacyl-ACP reductase-like protein